MAAHVRGRHAGGARAGDRHIAHAQARAAEAAGALVVVARRKAARVRRCGRVQPARLRQFSGLVSAYPEPA